MSKGVGETDAGQTQGGLNTSLKDEAELPKYCQSRVRNHRVRQEQGTWVLFMTELLCDLEQLIAPLSHGSASLTAKRALQ